MFIALLLLINAGTMVTSIAIITGTCIYLRYKIIHSKKFFKSVKRSTAEEQKAVKVGRLMEILQEQVKPTFSVFIAQGIDAVFYCSWIDLHIWIRYTGFSFTHSKPYIGCHKSVSAIQPCCCVWTA